MICPNCNQQIPDDSTSCPFCAQVVGSPFSNQSAPSEEENVSSQPTHQDLKKAVSLRRFQRWFFYFIIAAMGLGVLGVIIRITNANSQLLLDIANTKGDLVLTVEELELKKADLEELRRSLDATRQTLDTTKQDLDAKTDDLLKKEELVSQLEKTLTEKDVLLEEKTKEFKALLEQKMTNVKTSDDCSQFLRVSEANVYSLIVEIGEGISDYDLSRIPLAEFNFEGVDTDGDGLSDIIEKALGTDPKKADTDGDGYSDKQELLAGYNPLGLGALPIDKEFANRYKGKILLQIENEGQAWLVAGDGKRYFLGNPGNALEFIYCVQSQKEENSQTSDLSSAKQKARDARRLSDVKQIQTALELYFSEEGSYPNTLGALITTKGTTFMTQIPKDPLTDEEYVYARDGQATYSLKYTLESGAGGVSVGCWVATPASIINSEC